MDTVNRQRNRGLRGSGTMLVSAAFVAGVLLAGLPAAHAPVIALGLLDPSPTDGLASLDPSPTPAPDPTVAPDPTTSPDPATSPDPTPAPNPDPTAGPDPSASPDSSPAPESSPTPELTPSAEPSPDATPLASPSATPAPSATPLPQGVIGPDGGAVVDGIVTLTIPPGTVANPTHISAARVSVAAPPPAIALFGFEIRAVDDLTGAGVVTFGQPIAIAVDASGLSLDGIDASRLAVAELVEGSWSTIGTGSIGSLTASTDHVGTYGILGTPEPVRVTLDQSSDAPHEGRHRLEPGALLTVTASVRPVAPLDAGLLVETIPDGWQVVDAGDAVVDGAASTVTWSIRSVPGGHTETRDLRARAPDLRPDGQLTVPSTFSVRFEQGPAQTYGPDLAVLVAPSVVVAHVTAGQVARPGADATYLAPDAPLTGEPRYQVFRLRFDVANADGVPVRWSPSVEVRPDAGGSFGALPAGTDVPGQPFYAAPEWVRIAGGGTEIGPDRADLAASSLAPARDMPDQVRVDGLRAMGLNPLPALVLPPLSRTVVEFSIRATADAAYLTAYDFRLTDGGAPIAWAADARVVLEAAPPLQLTLGQRVGTAAGERTAAVTTPIRFALASGSTAPGNTPGPDSTGSSLRFALVTPAGTTPAADAGPSQTTGTSSAAGASPLQTTGGIDAVHGPAYSLATDACAACHRAHDAAGAMLTASPPPQIGLCSSCHNGTDAPDITAGYATAPVNVPADRAYFQHDPSAIDDYPLTGDEALAGQLIRRNECTECHNPHNATSTRGVSSSAGWTAPGSLSGASSVTVTNGAAGSNPAYALVAATSLEYQLCLKCHSGYTQLLSNDGLPPSRFELDKGVELNPGNLSYHPVEAPGTNATVQMAASLSGTSPYKLWDFTTDSTIRCVSCHADSSVIAAALANGSPAPADASLAVHASTNRGILAAGYKDRTLKTAIEPYTASDFALCYLCHAEAPFVDKTGNVRDDTNFRYHGLHVSAIADYGTGGTDIDTAGAGSGLATCAECHFRIHSTTYAVNGQGAGSRLVNFAPDVTAPTGGTLGWQAKTSTEAGTCTLKCHGVPHDPKNY